MLPQAKTIQIYLPQGNPRGIRIAEITTRTVKVIEIPRVHLQDFLAMQESLQLGLYFLVGRDEDNGQPQLYIGQTSELRRRLTQHNAQKEFWERVFVMLSTNNTITQTHALYLEYKAIETAKRVNRYELLNGNNGMLPHVPAPLKADCEELFHTMSILLSTMGQPIFDSLQIFDSSSEKFKSVNSADTNKDIYYCKTAFADAKGYYDEDGFIILKGSLVRREAVNSLGNRATNIRRKLIEQKKLVEHNDSRFLQLTENHLCNTPSGASQIVLGHASNGWNVWINAEGETLDTVYRRNTDLQSD